MHTFKNDEDRLDHLKQLVNVLPELPGVYQYFDKTGKIIYVGKAKNLRRRVSSYFMKKQQTPKTTVLVSKICDIKHIVVNNDNDAFLLENNLIKKHKPRYNILLKDDKTYPWIAILNEPFPRVIQTRRHVRDGSIYYGPYPSISQIHDLFDTFKQLYPLRTCALNLSKESINRGSYKVCLKYHLKSCEGPCEGLVSEEKYAQYIDGVRSILRGGTSQLIRGLKAEMMQAAEDMEFEQAEVLRKKIERLAAYQSKSLVSSNSILNCDVFGIKKDDEGGECFINFMRVTDGQIISSYTMRIDCKIEESDEEVLMFAIERVKESSGTLKKEIVVAVKPEMEFEGVSFTVPAAGEKKRLLELSEKNARLYKLELLKQEANRNRASHEDKLMIQIKELLGLPKLPQHMECFDNSNIQGTNAVAACVVYKNCKPSRQDYRLFNIKTVEGPDDYASMYEVVSRRYSRMLSEGVDLPDVLVADGGQGQMEVMRAALEDLGVEVPIVGLAKDNRHRTNQILVGFPPKIVETGKNDSVFRFFTRMQDEVHRVAITFHRNKRSKSMVSSELDSITGIGPKTKEKLLKQFGDVKSIREASADQLSNCIGAAKGNVVFKHFHSSDTFELKQ